MVVSKSGIAYVGNFGYDYGSGAPISDGIPSASPIREPLASNLEKISELHSEIDRPDYLGNGIRQIQQ